MQTAVPLDFNPPQHWNTNSDGILSLLAQNEFRDCFLQGATMYQVQLSLSMWLGIYLKVFVHPIARNWEPHERYNVVWAMFGYTDGMPEEFLTLMDQICT